MNRDTDNFNERAAFLAGLVTGLFIVVLIAMAVVVLIPDRCARLTGVPL